MSTAGSRLVLLSEDLGPVSLYLSGFFSGFPVKNREPLARLNGRTRLPLRVTEPVVTGTIQRSKALLKRPRRPRGTRRARATYPWEPRFFYISPSGVPVYGQRGFFGGRKLRVFILCPG